MKELNDCVKRHSVTDVAEIQKCITGMVCQEDEPIPLTEKSLVEAIELEGEFLVLKLHYDDFANELESEKIKYKISQSLSVIVSYEDDGNSFRGIEKFIKYVHAISDDKQNSTFGVKKVDKLSEFPITILFSAILPINQLKMTVGKEIDTLIHSDDNYFLPRFQKHRDDISQEIGIAILPVLPILDTELGDFHVRLVDQQDGRVISEFEVYEELSKDTIEIYLMKLFYVYKVLAYASKQK